MFGLFPRDTGFYELFDESATTLERAARAFKDLVVDYGRAKEHLAEIRQIEHDGDSVARRTFLKLDTTFITPFDREDIQALVNQIDNVIDAIDAAAQRMLLFKIVQPPEAIVKQSDVLQKACVHIRQAMTRLRQMRKPEEIRNHLIEIHHLENVGDDTNHEALAALFTSDPPMNPLEVMKLKELYDLTEAAIDGCEDAANTIERIILKNM